MFYFCLTATTRVLLQFQVTIVLSTVVHGSLGEIAPYPPLVARQELGKFVHSSPVLTDLITCIS